MPNSFSADTEKDRQMLDFLRDQAIAEKDLAKKTGLSESALHAIREIECFPRPSYVVPSSGEIWNGLAFYLSANSSPLPSPPLGTAYYGRAILRWLQRAYLTLRAEGKEKTPEALKAWFAKDCEMALLHPDCRFYGWSQLFSENGALERNALHSLLGELWNDWMSGLLGVCLEEFDGHHIVTKIRERARIQTLLKGKQSADLTAQDKVLLYTSMAQLDKVVALFDPQTRPRSTRGLWIEPVAMHCEFFL